MEVESEQELTTELRDFIDCLIVPLLVDGLESSAIQKMTEDTAETGRGSHDDAQTCHCPRRSK
jgi:hypothetical protein